MPIPSHRECCSSTRIATLAFVLAVAGCDACSRRDGARAEPRPQPTWSAVTASGLATQSTTTAGPGAPAAASSTAARSAVPTSSEWGVSKEVAVTGASALGCDARAVREWIRVSCRGANHRGEVIRSVAVDGGARPGDVFTFSAEELASLVIRLVEGTAVTVTFRWDQGHYPLAIRWEQGQARPDPVGVFTGAPIDEVQASVRRQQCTCYWRSLSGGPVQLPKGDPCVGVPEDAWARECARSHPDDCSGLVECQHMEPTGWAECLEGEVHYGFAPSSRCAPACGKGLSACRAGLQCDLDLGREPGRGVCLSNR